MSSRARRGSTSADAASSSPAPKQRTPAAAAAPPSRRRTSTATAGAAAAAPSSPRRSSRTPKPKRRYDDEYDQDDSALSAAMAASARHEHADDVALESEVIAEAVPVEHPSKITKRQRTRAKKQYEDELDNEETTRRRSTPKRASAKRAKARAWGGIAAESDEEADEREAGSDENHDDEEEEEDDDDEQYDEAEAARRRKKSSAGGQKSPGLAKKPAVQDESRPWELFQPAKKQGIVHERTVKRHLHAPKGDFKFVPTGDPFMTKNCSALAIKAGYDIWRDCVWSRAGGHAHLQKLGLWIPTPIYQAIRAKKDWKITKDKAAAERRRAREAARAADAQ